MPKGLEIEKKYLIAYPDEELLLKKGAVVKEIEQTYLTSDVGSERVREFLNAVFSFLLILKYFKIPLWILL